MPPRTPPAAPDERRVNKFQDSVRPVVLRTPAQQAGTGVPNTNRAGGCVGESPEEVFIRGEGSMSLTLRGSDGRWPSVVFSSFTATFPSGSFNAQVPVYASGFRIASVIYSFDMLYGIHCFASKCSRPGAR